MVLLSKILIRFVFKCVFNFGLCVRFEREDYALTMTLVIFQKV